MIHTVYRVRESHGTCSILCEGLTLKRLILSRPEEKRKSFNRYNFTSAELRQYKNTGYKCNL